MRGVFLDTTPVDQADIDFFALQQLPVKWAFYPKTTSSEIVSRAEGAQIIITNKVHLGRREFEALPDLRCIIVSATGVNNVDVEAAARRGICVCNTRNYATESVAQHTLMLMLALAGQFIPYSQAARDGRWVKSESFAWAGPPQVELATKVVGIIGLGVLGTRVKQLCQAMGMEVIVAQRDQNDTRPGRVPRAVLLETSDIVTLHCPLTKQTKGLIDACALSKMKKTAFLINVARGDIVDEHALAHALRNQQIAGAATDVLSVEPPSEDNPLLAHDIPNLIITPHVAWATLAARQRIIEQLAQMVKGFLQGNPMHQVCAM